MKARFVWIVVLVLTMLPPGTQRRAIDHIGLEVKDLEGFRKKFEEGSVKIKSFGIRQVSDPELTLNT